MHGSTAGGLDCLAVVARKIESIGCRFYAHRDADARSFLHDLITANHRTIKPPTIITHVVALCVDRSENACLTYVQTSSYSLIKEACRKKTIGCAVPRCCSYGRTRTLRSRETGRSHSAKL